MGNGSGLRKGIGVTSGHPFFYATLMTVSFGLESGRECWEPTVGCCGWCQWGVGLHSLGSPQTGLKSLLGWHIPMPCDQTLAPETLEGTGVLPIQSASLAIFGSLSILSLASSSGGTHGMANRGAAGGSGLPQTSLTIMRVGASRSVPIHPYSPTASLSGAIWSTAMAVVLSCSGQAAISLAIWFPNSVVPLTVLVVTADLALTLSWASLFSLSTLQAVIMSWE